MEKLTRLTTEHRDNLTAYLDGELDESMTQQIETVLAQSTVARNDVEVLAKTYDLLDLLPRPKASNDFSEKTLSIAMLGEVRPDYRRSRWYKLTQRGGRWAGWAVILLAVSAVSFSIARFRIPREDDLLLDDLDVIQHLDEYEAAGSVDFLRRLGLEAELLDKMKPEGSRAAQ
jgi:hypothetical protein